MLQDFFHFNRYLTPSIIRFFYLLQIVLVLLFGLSSLFGSIAAMFVSFLGGIAWLIGSLLVTAVGLVAVRISTELVMVLFQNNEHLAAIRARAEGH